MATSQTENGEKRVSTNIVVLPRVTVQHDISTVIEDVRDGLVAEGWEDIWVSCYHEGKTSIHGKVRISRSAVGISFEPREGIEWHGTSTAEFRVACPGLNVPAKPIRLPKHVYKSTDPLQAKKITAFDVSPDGRLYATGHSDGSILICPTSLDSTNAPTLRRRVCTPHLSTVLSLKFFPSSVVLLSSSSDLSVRIHDANLSIPDTTVTHPISAVRTLQAHTAGVTSTAIIDRGRNVLSFGRDGSARLWDVGGGKEITGRRWRAQRGSPILCGCVGEQWQSAGRESSGNSAPVGAEESPSGIMLNGEVGTTGKVVFVGLRDGAVRGYELATGHARFFSSGIDPSLTNSKSAPIDSICYSAESGALVAGRRDGVIMVWDLTADVSHSPITTPKSPDLMLGEEHDRKPNSVFKRNGAGVESVAFSPAIGTSEAPMAAHGRFPSILAGMEDGLLCRIGVDTNYEPVLMEEFIGVEAGDGIRVVKPSMLDGMEICWSAGDDGFVRRY